MKKTLATLCALALAACSLAACGSNNSKSDSNSAALSQPSEQPRATAAAPTEAASDYLGTWTYDRAASSKRFADSGSLVLNADNTFALTSSSSASANKTEVEAGTYTVSGSSITLTLTHYTETRDGKVTSDEDIPNGNSLDGTISGNQMVLGTGNNTVVFIK